MKHSNKNFNKFNRFIFNLSIVEDQKNIVPNFELFDLSVVTTQSVVQTSIGKSFGLVGVSTPHSEPFLKFFLKIVEVSIGTTQRDIFFKLKMKPFRI